MAIKIAEHTLHGDAAAIKALVLVARFAVSLFVAGSAPQAAAHVNFVFDGANLLHFRLGGILIKAIFFDYDGVLTTDKTGSTTTTRYLSQATGIELSTVKAAFSRHNKDLTSGKITHAEIWHELCSALGQEVSISLLYEAFESTPMNEGMFSLARKLKKDYLVGIITDNKKDRIDHLKRCQNLESLFSPIVVSAEVGIDKGSTEIFVYALHCASVSAEESVFVDNNKDNLNAPSDLGIKTVFHDDEKNDIDALCNELKRFGVLTDNA